MTNCKHLKQKFNKTLECKKQKVNGKNKVINIKECNGCKYREFVTNSHELKKCTINTKYCANKIKKRTYKQAKKEKERYSIIYEDNTQCCYCGSKSEQIDINEIFSGAYRSLSIKYGACNYYCRECHRRYDVDRLFNLQEKVKFQKELVKIYGYDWFMNTFKQDYEYLLKKYLSTKKALE